MSFLALDLGEKRVGVAISRSKILAEPLSTISFNRDFYQELEAICLIEKVEKIIIGLPKSFGDEENNQEKKIRRTADLIRKKLKIKIEFIDESFSTKIAQERKAEDVDQEAAVIILEDYIDSRGN
ncbi:Holliday junction resolvase RuvX [Patescibacteria group bacterium]|nr:Holliday junction resolvase RuvX [Patescibacteria group bacterium]